MKGIKSNKQNVICSYFTIFFKDSIAMLPSFCKEIDVIQVVFQRVMRNMSLSQQVWDRTLNTDDLKLVLIINSKIDFISTIIIIHENTHIAA